MLSLSDFHEKVFSQPLERRAQAAILAFSLLEDVDDKVNAVTAVCDNTYTTEAIQAMRPFYVHVRPFIASVANIKPETEATTAAGMKRVGNRSIAVGGFGARGRMR